MGKLKFPIIYDVPIFLRTDNKFLTLFQEIFIILIPITASAQCTNNSCYTSIFIISYTTYIEAISLIIKNL